MPTLKPVGIGILGFVVLVCAGPNARAQESTPRVSLRWNAPDECPDDAELVRSVEDFLGESLAAAGAQQLSISLSVTAGSSGFSAKMRFRGPDGVEERFLDHPECRKLMEACALLAALAIDPERVKARQTSSREAAATPLLPTPAAPPVPPKPTETAAPKTAPQSPAAQPVAAMARAHGPEPELEIAGFVSGGVLPKVAPGFSALLALERAHFELGLIGRYFIPRSVSVPESQNGEIELGLWTLGPRACVLPWLGPWSLRGCLGADFGDMLGTGHGLPGGRTSHAVFTSLNAGLALRYGRRRLAPVLGVDAGWAPTPAPFGVTNGTQKVETFRPDRRSWSSFVGLSYRL